MTTLSVKSMYRITTDFNPTEADQKAVRDGITSFNSKMLGEQSQSFSVYLRDEEGNICGGIIAWLHSLSVYIDVLWVDEKLRGQGYGQQLLLTAEREAIRHGCFYSTLDTYTFQAEGFYLKNGYVRLGEIKEYLSQNAMIVLRKNLK